MASSAAATVDEYLGQLPDDRREAIAEVRDEILANLPDGLVETMAWGMIAYEVPLEVLATYSSESGPSTVDRGQPQRSKADYPATSNKKPLLYAALASQKNHMAVYLHSMYLNDGDADWFKEKYIATGKKLDMGSSCVRFKKIDQLPVELIGEAIAKVSVDEFVDHHRSSKD